MDFDNSDIASEIERLAQILDRHALTRLEYQRDTCHVVLEKLPAVQGTSIIGQAVAEPATPPSAVAEPAVTIVRTPLVGIAYGSREPGAAPFVTVGSQVSEGDVLCLVEAMKMFNEITAPVAGTVTAIHFQDGCLVEYGSALISIG